MVFPERDRVIYKFNPLNEVICQLRFPTILRINQGDPVDFQEKIRHQYPLYSFQNREVSSEIAEMGNKMGMGFPFERVHTFEKENAGWKISLTKNALSISTTEYTQYEEFKSNFQEVVSAFETIYKPSYYTRIGLRYQDVIIRSELGLQDKNWNELLAEPIITELQDPIISNSLKFFNKTLLLAFEESEAVLRHGIVNVEKEEVGLNEEGYLLDADFYVDQRIDKSHDIFEFTDRFNKYSRNLFRFCITDTLHDAMEPSPAN